MALAWLDIVEKLILPTVTFCLGFVTDHYLKYRQNKKERLEAIESKFRNIIELSGKENCSIPLLTFDFNIVLTTLREYCRDYKIPPNVINDDLIDLTLFTTNDRIDSQKSVDIFSDIIRKLRLYRK